MKIFKRKPKAEAEVVKTPKSNTRKDLLKKSINEVNEAEANKKISKKFFTNQFILATKEFETTRIEEIEKSRIVAWRVAAASLLTTMLACIAIVFLTPLKEVEPYLVRVDNNTGQTDIVTVLANAKSDYGEEVAKFFASNYVRLVEGYDWYTIQTSFERALLFSSKEEQNRLNNKFASSIAPHKLYQKNKRVEIEIDNVSFIDENLIQVRFTKRIVNADGGVYNPQEATVSPAPIVSQSIATLGYDYVNVPEVDEVRLVNPLGFTVYTYRVDEVINPDSASTPAPVPTPEPALPVTGEF